MKHILLTIIATVIVSALPLSLLAQGVNVDAIRSDKAYFWAEGRGDTKKAATSDAQDELSRKITTFISNVDGQYIKNEQRGQDVNTSVSFESKMKSYSVATLNNCHSKMLSDKAPFKVFMYIDTLEVNRMFRNRENMVREYVKIANEAYENLNIADALRYYYSSYLLTQSLRYRSEAMVTDEKGGQQRAMSWIKRRIEQILSGVKVSLIDKNEGDANTYRLGFFYKDKPVSRIGYTYYYGSDWSERPEIAIDGQGLATLQPGFEPGGMKVRIEYKYVAQAQNDRELATVFDALSDMVDFGNYDGVSVIQRNVKSQTQQDRGQGVSGASKAQNNALSSVSKVKSEDQPLSASQAKLYADVMTKVVSAIRNKNYASVGQYCTAEGGKAFNELVHYGNARIVGTPNITFSEYYGHIYARSVPMQFSFRANNKFTENVVFTFNKEGKIDDVTFGLGHVAQDNLFCNMAEKELAPVRSAINNFLESYKTAYALGRFDYLDKVFDDNAVIITGKVISRMEKQSGDAESYRNHPQIIKHRQTKGEYLDNLKRAFASKEFVNIQFANNTIRPNSQAISLGKDVYGIQIRQDYFSNNYCDQGYLFLMVDVTNPDMPIIYVRVWQEKPDEYGEVFSISEL